MDLRQLERWTRDALVAEAARRGVESATLLTRRELLDAIAANAESQGETVTRSAVARARRFLERLAFGAQPHTGPPAPPSSPPLAPGATIPTPLPTHAGEAAPSVVAPREEHEPSEVEPEREPVVSPSEEPVATRTMARLLAAQGHIARARTIYDALLGAVPDDTTLRREADELTPPHRVAPALRAVHGVTPPLRRHVDQVTALVVDPTTLFVCWEVSDAGMRRARAVAGDDAPLALRVMIAASDSAGRVATRELTGDALPDAGETFVTGLPPGALCTAAVGVAGTRFVAIAHAPPAETPPAAPSTSLSLVARPLGAPLARDVGAPSLLSAAEATTRFAEAARADALVAAEDAAASGLDAPPSSPGVPGPFGAASRSLGATSSRGATSSPGARSFGR